MCCSPCCRALWLAIVVGSFASGGLAQESAAKKHAITVEDMWQVKRLGPPALSPDGKWVAVEVTTYRMEDNNSTSDIWLLATDGKTARQLTTHQGKNSDPAWSPDGKKIACLSQRAGAAAP